MDEDNWGGRAPAFPHLIKWVEMAVRARVERAMRPMTISSGQLLLLVILREKGSATAAELARAMHLTPQAMTTLLKPLTRDGLVEREPDPDNRRRILLSLAEKGESTIEEAGATAAGIEAELLGDLTAEERETLRALLMRIARPFA